MNGEGVEARLGAVLEEHHFTEPDLACSCRQWRPDFSASSAWFEQHAAHVAAALAAEVAAMQAEAVGAALREAADQADSVGHHWSGAPAHAFFTLAGDLRVRAEQDPA